MSGWRKGRLGDFILDIKDGGTPSRANPTYFGGDIAWCVVKDIRSEIHTTAEYLTALGLAKCSARVWPSGSVIISLGATIGEIGIARVPVATKQGLAGIVPNPELITSEFLAYALRHQVDTIRAMARGATIKEVRPKRLAEELAMAAPPIEQQRRIVAVLDEAFAAIATATVNAEKNLANARELSAMFPASQSDGNTRLTIGELLERGWLKGHMDGNHGGDYPRKDEFVDGGVTYLSANCIRDGLVDFDRAKFLTNERAGKLRKGFAKHRDVLFAHNATVGPVALLTTDADFVVLGTSLTYYRCDEEVILPEYLARYLRSPSFVEQYSAVMRQSTRNQVPITKQREFFVDIPPIAQQHQIVASLSGFQEDGRALAKLYRVKLDALSALKQSLLHCAFTGELTAVMPETIAA